MKKQIDPRQVVSQFGQYPVSLDDLSLHFESAFNWDAKKAYARDLKSFTRRQLSHIKDKHGVRCFVAFNASSDNEPRSMLYQMVETCDSPEILKRQKAELSRTISGTTDTWIKVDIRLDHITGQAAAPDSSQNGDASNG